MSSIAFYQPLSHPPIVHVICLLKKLGQFSSRMSCILIWLTPSSFCHFVYSFILLMSSNLEVRFTPHFLEGDQGYSGWGHAVPVARHQESRSATQGLGSGLRSSAWPLWPLCYRVPSLSALLSWFWHPLTAVTRIHYFIWACERWVWTPRFLLCFAAGGIPRRTLPLQLFGCPEIVWLEKQDKCFPNIYQFSE